ncbi:MAG TPA: 3-mercaptopyruvate sulfurtransferase [Gemmatimonadales bacterium]|jgi:thiosulfate/3-mercaptopyruvate sulfurtransferase|nr:3-mercaptopyruvate sulfurtransferase [Gemmatimonadales bacterium]
MPATLPTPLVSTEWLAAHLGEPGLVVIDASWYLAAMNRDARAEYETGHIPGAVYWDLDLLSDRNSPLPHMLSDPELLARQIGELGIGTDDRVVVYDASGLNLSAPRVWWTFKVAGHDDVAVLDGGLALWKAENRPLEQGWVRRDPARFPVRFRPALLKSLAEMRALVESGDWQILDARTRGRFEGSEPEPRPGLRAGHLPGARNLPFTELVDAAGKLLPRSELRRRYQAAGVDPSRPIVATCGSGVTACALALGLELLGSEQYAVYDGSWSEWGAPAGPPIEPGPARKTV